MHKNTTIFSMTLKYCLLKAKAREKLIHKHIHPRKNNVDKNNFKEKTVQFKL